MKSFREQMKECRLSGNLIRVLCNWCKHEILVCKKYDTYCHSKACLEERKSRDKKIQKMMQCSRMFHVAVGCDLNICPGCDVVTFIPPCGAGLKKDGRGVL